MAAKEKGCESQGKRARGASRSAGSRPVPQFQPFVRTARVPRTRASFRFTPSRGATLIFVRCPPPPGTSPFFISICGRLSRRPTIAPSRQPRSSPSHLNGDMGGIKNGMNQQLVAKGMEQDFDAKVPASENPAFLYIVGGLRLLQRRSEGVLQASFTSPTSSSRGRSSAVPGNHDGENLPGQDPLDGFLRKLLRQAKPVKMPEVGRTSNRTAMDAAQRLLDAADGRWASFVGLYSNVPAGGENHLAADRMAGERAENLADGHPAFSSACITRSTRPTTIIQAVPL